MLKLLYYQSKVLQLLQNQQLIMIAPKMRKEEERIKIKLSSYSTNIPKVIIGPELIWKIWQRKLDSRLVKSINGIGIKRKKEADSLK